MAAVRRVARDLQEEQFAVLDRLTTVNHPGPRLVAAVVTCVLFIWACVDDGALWRKLILGAIGVLGNVVALRGHSFHRRKHIGLPHARPAPRTQSLMGLAALLTLAAVAFATGGFDSPVTPLLVPLCFVLGTVNPSRALVSFAAATISFIWGAALISARASIPDLMPAVFGGGPSLPQPRALLFSRAGALTFMVLWAAYASDFVRSVFHGMVEDALDARDDALRSQTDHAQTLIALSGEIAHELKNPLSSIKGLANLVSRDLDGKPAERIGVLRREVDRMEEILNGFLNFSRPLLPLHQELVTVRGLCEQVVALYEGLARERRIMLRIDDEEEESIEVACDRRKIKQVLINLVQNAVDASPPGATIALVVLRTDDGGVRIEVRDRGTGLADAVRSRLFEPGATTKDNGSGLGLALARGLARQHGGELQVREREGGGCAASLVLPGASP